MKRMDAEGSFFPAAGADASSTVVSNRSVPRTGAGRWAGVDCDSVPRVEARCRVMPIASSVVVVEVDCAGIRGGRASVGGPVDSDLRGLGPAPLSVALSACSRGRDCRCGTGRPAGVLIERVRGGDSEEPLVRVVVTVEVDEEA